MKNHMFLYASNATTLDFTGNNGFGSLSDYANAYAVEARNGEYEIEFKYPINGRLYSEIALRRIVLAKANPYDQKQPFRIYSISEPENGIVEIKARHWSYDLNTVPVSPFAATNISGAILYMNSNGMIPHQFTITTDKASTGVMEVKVPTSFRSLMGGVKGSLLDVYGGEYHYDRDVVELLSARGRRDQDHAYEVTYKRNLVSYKSEKNSGNTVSGIVGYWQSKKDDAETPIVITSPVYTQNTSIPETDQQAVIVVDFSNDYEEAPTEQELTDHALAYLTNSGKDLFDRTITFSFVEDPEFVGNVGLCDYVKVKLTKYNTVALAKVIKTTFNIAEDRFEKVEVGSARTNLTDKIISQSRELTEEKQNLVDESRQIRMELERTATMLREAISDNQGNTTELKQTLDELSAIVASINHSLSLTMTDQQLLLEFIETVNGRIDSESEGLGAAVEGVISKYIRFIDGCIVLGRDDNIIKLKLFNDMVAFFSGDDSATDMSNAFALFSSKELDVHSIYCKKNFKLGDHWEWLERSNKHLTLWRLDD